MFLDNASTTPLTPQVKEYIISLLDTYQNPSSVYQSGLNIKKIITTARNNTARFINTNPQNIIFTSGGSASNTLGIKGYIEKHNCDILYQPTCHKSILKCVKYIKNAHPLKVDNQGFIDINDLQNWFSTHRKSLVVIEQANSEIGTIQNVKQIIDLCHFYNSKVYMDCTGSISQIPVDIKKLNIDMLGFSGHKIHALKGVGVFYKNENIELEPLIYGSQNNELFGGTYNTLGIASLGKAIEDYDYTLIKSNNRDYIYNYIINNIPNSYLIGGDLKHRLAHNLYLCFQGVEGEALLTFLDMNGYQVSTGSACASRDLTPSSTLTAIGIDNKDIHSCIRITLSGNESTDEVNSFCKSLKNCVEILRKLNK